MPSARYWRLTGVAPRKPGALTMSGIALYGADGRVASGVPQSSHTPISGSLTNLADDNVNTAATFASNALASAGFFIGWDLGAARDVTDVRLSSAASRDEFPASLTLEYRASTADAWTTLTRFGAYIYPGDREWTPEPLPGDPYDSMVTAHLRFDGNFDDIKGHKFVAYGSAGIDTVSPLVGSGSYVATAGGYARSAASDDWDLGSLDFCYEGRASTSDVSKLSILITGRNGASGNDFGPTVFVDGGRLRAFIGDAPNSIAANCVGGTVVANQLFHWRYARQGSTFRLFLNGAAVASATFAGACRGGAPMTIGRDESTSGREWIGRQDEIKLTKGTSRGLGNYTPEAGPLPSGAGSSTPIFEAIPMACASVPQLLGHSATPADPVVRRVGAALQGRDMEFGGTGSLRVNTKIKGQPDTNTRAKVTIERLNDKVVARVGWSSATTGVVTFEGLDTQNQQFLAIAEYPSNPADPTAPNYMRPVAGVSPLEVLP